MKQLIKIDSKFGHIDVFHIEAKNLLYAIPNGYVGPELVKKDLQFLGEFNDNTEDEWQYILDTSNVKIVNPINPFLLRGLSQLSKMKEYVVYAPSPMVRTMIILTSRINKPDRIIKSHDTLQSELNSLK